jgi:hypothetical protein
MYSTQSWAPTMEQVDTDHQQPTPDKGHTRQPPTATPETQQLALDKQHPTTDNPTDTETNTRQPTVNNRREENTARPG